MEKYKRNKKIYKKLVIILLALILLVLTVFVVGAEDDRRDDRQSGYKNHLEDGMVVVESVKLNGLNAESGLLPGDQVLKAGGKLVTNEESLEFIIKQMETGGKLPLVIKRGEVTLEFDIAVKSAWTIGGMTGFSF